MRVEIGILMRRLELIQRMPSRWRRKAREWRNWDKRNVPPHRMIAHDIDEMADELEAALAGLSELGVTMPVGDPTTEQTACAARK